MTRKADHPPGRSEPADPEPFVRLLRRHGVDFVVIGGIAEQVMGGARPTYDVDLCYKRDRQSLERLAAALRELRPTLRGAPPDLPFVIDAQSLALGANYTFVTEHGPLDLLGIVDPLGNFDDIDPRAEVYSYEGSPLRVIALEDLIRVKEHIKRDKDRESLAQLYAIRRRRKQAAAGG